MSSSTIFSLFLTTAGDVYGLGIDEAGHMGVGAKVKSVFADATKMPIQNVKKVGVGTTGYVTGFLKADGQYYSTGTSTTSGHAEAIFTPKFLLQNVVEFDIGQSHTIALLNDSTCYIWGSNSFGQLGTGDKTTRQLPVKLSITSVTQVAAGDEHTIVLKNSSEVYVFGNNQYGQLGDGTFSQSTNPKKLTFDGTIIQQLYAFMGKSHFLTKSGQVYSFGSNFQGSLGDNSITNRNVPVLLNTVNNITKVSGNLQNTLFLRKDGSVFTVGDNTYGQLGDGKTTANTTVQFILKNESIFDVSSGGGSLFYLVAGEVYGAGFDKILGNKAVTFSQLPTNYLMKKISTNNDFSLMLKSNGSLHGIGKNDFGQLGNQTSDTSVNVVKVENVQNITDISIGMHHSLILTKDRTAFAIGRNHLGQVSNSSELFVNKATPIPIPNIRMIETGDAYSLVSDGIHVFSFGDNSNGQLGDGTTTKRNTPVTMLIIENIKKMVAGPVHTLILMKNGSVGVCGQNSFGELGIRITNSVTIPLFVENIGNITDIATGSYHTLYLNANGSVFGSGMNSNGQLALGNTADREYPTFITTNITAVFCGPFSSFFMSADGVLLTSGLNGDTQLGDINLFSVLEMVPIHKRFKITNVATSTSATVFSVSGCANGYHGLECKETSCHGKNSTDPTVCSSRGSCTSPNICNCTTGYSGENCEFHSCSGKLSNDPNVCNSRGICSSANNCTCNSGYTGVQCELINCFGKNSSHIEVCTGRGTCVSPNNCSCQIGYSGIQCEFTTCYGKNSTNPLVCSGRGDCAKLNTCICPPEYLGSECNAPVCYGKNPFGQTSCSGSDRGTCIAPNNCSCKAGYTGNECEFQVAVSPKPSPKSSPVMMQPHQSPKVSNSPGKSPTPQLSITPHKSAIPHVSTAPQTSMNPKASPIPKYSPQLSNAPSKSTGPKTSPQVSPKTPAISSRCKDIRGGHKVEWSIENNHLNMTFTFFKGNQTQNKGWVAVGFNKVGSTMIGASIIMAYGANINEYSASSFSKPDLMTTQKITSKSSTSMDNNIVVKFVRPLSDPNDSNYFAIKNEIQNIFVAWNDVETPTNPSTFSKHTATPVITQLNLYEISSCNFVSSASLSKTSVFAVFTFIVAIVFI